MEALADAAAEVGGSIHAKLVDGGEALLYATPIAAHERERNVSVGPEGNRSDGVAGAKNVKDCLIALHCHVEAGRLPHA